MTALPPEEEIKKLLEELRSKNADHRKMAAQALGALGAKSDEILKALETAASVDPNRYVRLAAKGALHTLERGIPSAKETEPATESVSTRTRYYTTRNQKILHFVIGFVAWWVISGALWRIGMTCFVGDLCLLSAVFFNLLAFIANLLTLIILAFTRRWVALGALVALAVNLLITLIMGGLLWALIFGFMPFFTPGLQGP